MLGAGATCVIGIDPTLLFVMQFAALRHFLPELPVHVLPLACEELPPDTPAFDTVFSMGVLYHRRSPLEHLRELRDQLLAGGELVLETLVLPGEEALARTPADRYARMRNVWLLPTVAGPDPDCRGLAGPAACHPGRPQALTCPTSPLRAYTSKNSVQTEISEYDADDAGH